MKKRTQIIFDELVFRYPVLVDIVPDILEALSILLECHKNGNKILICGNGGSAADSEHISGELIKGFMLERTINKKDIEIFNNLGEDGICLIKNLQQGIRAIPLPSYSSGITAYMNDMNPDLVYAQLTYALGLKGDVLIPISTSGNSKNTYFAALVARTIGMNIIALSGKTGGKLNGICDVCIKVPEDVTYKIQELHLPVYHSLCLALESELFKL